MQTTYCTTLRFLVGNELLPEATDGFCVDLVPAANGGKQNKQAGLLLRLHQTACAHGLKVI